jgi:hypothetical protein
MRLLFLLLLAVSFRPRQGFDCRAPGGRFKKWGAETPAPYRGLRMRMLQVLLLAPVASLVSAAEAPETVTVPLDTVWAHEMPGTRDIHLLQQEFDKRFPPMGKGDQSLVEFIGRAIESRRGGPVGEALAVQGEGIDALININNAFINHDIKPRGVKGIVGKDGVSLFFFTAYSPRYVHLKEITRSGALITVKYALIPHHTLNRTMHLALVPLGELPKGEYRVEVSQTPMTEDQSKQGFKDVDDQWGERHVSSSFTFHVN